MKKSIAMMILLTLLFLVSSCGEDPPIIPVDDEANTGNDSANTGDDTGNTGNDTGDTSNTGNDDSDTAPDDGDSGDCDTSKMGNSCTVDTECGKCMICTTGGKCTKGCTVNEDCTMATGLKCNKKLARCTNVFASLQACGETKCPTGCCYGEKGLTEVKCLTTAEASKCGLCAQGEIYIPTDSKCVSAVCSTTTDNCKTLNAGSTSPKPECFECKSGEFICKAKTGTSGCSAGVLINAAQCIPAGQQCVAGVSECCSGMPCIQGYCY